MIPTLLGLVSRIDQTGRSTALGIAVASTGQAVGPGVCGVLAANGGYASIGWFVGACYLISIAIVVGFLTSWHLARARQPAVA